MDEIIKFLIKNDNWKFFAGVLVGAIGFILKTLYEHLVNKKVKIGFSIENNSLVLYNLSKKESIDINTTVFKIYDITQLEEYSDSKPQNVKPVVAFLKF